MQWLTLSILLSLLGSCSRSASPFELADTETRFVDISDLYLPELPTELEELPTDTDLPTELEELPTDTDLPTELEELPTDTNLPTELEELPTDTDLPTELEELPTDTDLPTELEELPTNTDASTDIEKDTCFMWIYLATCLPCFNCDACRHGSQAENELAGCYGSIAHMGDCDGYFFYIPFEKDDTRPECDAVICCEELPDAS